MTSWHFEHIAAEYATARPPYPTVLFDVLRSEQVIGPGLRVLEIGAGAGLATRQLVASGSHVVAIEPGQELASLLERAVPAAQILVSSLEEAELPLAEFDSVVAATSMHWVDLETGLPKLHSALRPGGLLAVFRTIFGDDTIETDFRARVKQIVAERAQEAKETSLDWRPTMDELSSGGYFRPVRSERWQWSVDLTTDEVTRLFRTFSGWTEEEVQAIREAAAVCGGVVAEHYQTALHLLSRH